MLMMRSRAFSLMGRRFSATVDRHLDSVLKIYSVNSAPNYVLPWQKKPQREVSGSGFVLDGRKIITNAHVVADQNWIQVRRHGSPQKFTARAQFVNHECDLALLEVTDPAFWDGLGSLELGVIPKMQDKVVVAGYPTCGDNLCVTSGVVSRVEPQQYCHGASSLLAVQIDAAINPGNSGGPALMGGKVAGVAFQSHIGSENCGFIIPVSVVEHFLEESTRSADRGGFCSLGITCQATENAYLRSFLRLPSPGIGVLVNKIRPLSPAVGHILQNDVLIAFDGHSIASDGTINWRDRERVSFDYLISKKFAGDTCNVVVLRDGVEHQLEIRLWTEEHLVPVHQYDRQPQYLVQAGLVFTPLVQPYLHEFGDDWYTRCPRKLCDLAMNGTISGHKEQVIVLSQVLTHALNIGYSDLVNLQVVKFDDVKINNMVHLAELFDGARARGAPYVRLELDDNRVIAIDLVAAAAANDAILSQHRVPTDRSADLILKTDETSRAPILMRTAPTTVC